MQCISEHTHLSQRANTNVSADLYFRVFLFDRLCDSHQQQPERHHLAYNGNAKINEWVNEEMNEWMDENGRRKEQKIEIMAQYRQIDIRQTEIDR